MKIKATVDIEQMFDDNEFNSEKWEREKKSKYKDTKATLQKMLDDALWELEFDSVNVKSVKVEYED